MDFQFLLMSLDIAQFELNEKLRRRAINIAKLFLWSLKFITQVDIATGRQTQIELCREAISEKCSRDFIILIILILSRC